MQTIGYIEDHQTGRKIKVLVRQGKFHRDFKRRFYGKDGVHFTDEESHLNSVNSDAFWKLKKGETVSL